MGHGNKDFRSPPHILVREQMGKRASTLCTQLTADRYVILLSFMFFKLVLVSSVVVLMTNPDISEKG